ncbi:hypothetical protein ACH4E7_06945 [Kitasatospora sp. NPDC018058]|uniref:hypothetical protein n=1 Tax=Kitasatospora sp. NPDC018058 TaxID=3364025 RepID=UPI0037C181A5
MTPPTSAQLDHLIGHTANRALTPDEHAALRDGIQALRASLAGTGTALRTAPSGAYHRQVVEQLRAAEDELGRWRRQGRRADRYRAAWLSARQRAEAYGEGILQRCEDRDTVYSWLRTAQAATATAVDRAEQVEARIAAAYRFADEMATYCSPHGVASLYAERLRAALDEAQP